VSLLRSTTSNENIYAEQCDLTSPTSIRSFCTNYHKSEQRLDAIIFAHEYAPIGNLFSRAKSSDWEEQRRTASCATFLIVTLLLPLLLTAPVERDIRLITLVNPFYAAAVRTFSVSQPSAPSSSSLFLAEGRRALRTAVFMRHLQRVLDALPSSSQVPRTDVNSQSIPVVSDKTQRSNIVAVSVSPGISRTDVIAPLLAADTTRGKVSWGGLIL
jgi:NAD(P)-dependent dehydrogenase (short-subunit alcohol dehydrogenase family)